MNKYEYGVELNKKFGKYSNIFSKYGVTLANMASMQNSIDSSKYKITVIEEKYRNISGRWELLPEETNMEEVDVEYYLNVISSIPMFKTTVQYK